jgi:hypothetical protein
MSRALALLLGMWLWAAGSAQAVVHDLGVVGPNSSFPLFGIFLEHQESWQDIYAFDAPWGPHTGTILPLAAITTLGFPIYAQFQEWNGHKFVPVGPLGHGVDIHIQAPFLGSATGAGGTPPNRHFELVVSARPNEILFGGPLRSYGGTMGIAPEPELTLMLLVGLGIVVAFGRKRIA